MAVTLTATQAPQQASEPDFLALLPAIRRCASYALRHIRRTLREDLLAEVVANAFAAFKRLVARGKAALAYPTVLAKFALRQVRDGRRTGSRQNVLDVMSSYAQRKKGFAVRSLADGIGTTAWQEIVVEDRHASPAEIAGFKLDFATWLKRLQRTKRQIALRLAEGYSTSEVAAYFGLTPSRISQLRLELRRSWEAFQALPAAA